MIQPTTETIHFIITGGTIDSHYDPLQDTAVANTESIIPSYIESLKLHQPTDFSLVCMKDSRELNEQDRKSVLEIVQKSEHRYILITHGTYTMADTARYLKVNATNLDEKIVIFTASAIPLQGFSPSDAPFNLGYAIGRFESLSPGVYVAMNGRVFEPEEVMKELSEARFTSIFSREHVKENSGIIE